ncbi:GBS Bsp-like repeat-containing protein [Butyrivibrio sp. JL13D10]|uniref:GBS Bsp-like repeat-containing protein n=1 Tax=Butyrivibrio sp. JL13D10 TaxID=3236815 RepID=UPI0038B471D5
MNKNVRTNRVLVLVFVAAVLSRLVTWIFNNWGGLTMDEVVFTMIASKEGTNPAMLRDGVIFCIPVAIGVTLMAKVLLDIFEKKPFIKWIKMASVSLSTVVIISSIGYFIYKVNGIDYIKNQMHISRFIEDNYVNPELVSLKWPDKKRNLIYIFVESMETSFTDVDHGGGKEDNIIADLVELGLENETFSDNSEKINGGYALTGATYTMGGIFAQTSGLPLLISNNILTIAEGFFPKLTVLGDILDNNGYTNVFCIGTDASFAERDKYFNCHGNYQIRDYNYSIENGEISKDYSREWWGYDDFILYDNAKKHLIELANKNEPFNFTMLTVDTHAEDGYICELCDEKFGTQYSNAFDCASRQVTSFVRWIQEQDFYADTTIVISGDHCTMDSDYCDDLDKSYDRRVFTTWINSAINTDDKKIRKYSTMDYFPTVLASLGVDIEGNRLGLGTNLFSSEETLTEKYGVDKLNEMLSMKTSFFDQYIGETNDTRDISLFYDDDTGEVVVKIDKNEDFNGDFKAIECKMTGNKSDISQNKNMDLENNTYITRISLENFDYNEGDYLCEIYFVLPDGLERWYAEKKITIDKIKYESPLSVKYDKETNSLTIMYDMDRESDYKNVWMPVWGSENGQDDIVWYIAQRLEDGKWSVTVDVSKHTRFGGNINVDVYGGDDGPTDLLKSKEIIGLGK